MNQCEVVIKVEHLQNLHRERSRHQDNFAVTLCVGGDSDDLQIRTSLLSFVMTVMMVME